MALKNRVLGHPILPPKTLRISVEPVLQDTTEIPAVTDATEITFDVAHLEDNVKLERPSSPLGPYTDTVSESSAKPDEEITQAPNGIPVTNAQVVVVTSCPTVPQYRIGYIIEVILVHKIRICFVNFNHFF